jgi:hypothetical protein
MSGTFPATPAAQSVSVQSIEPTLVSTTISLKRQVRSRGGQRWLLDVVFAPMTRSEFAPIFAFGVKQKGQYETFTYVPPTISTTRGVTSETIIVNDAGVSAGDVSCAVDNLTVSTSNILRTGDFIKFSDHTKVYIVTEDMSSDGSGDATLNFAPSAVQDITDNSTVSIASVPFTVSFQDDVKEFGTNFTNLYSYEVSLIEVV